ncbi:hypothetical protein NP493_516g02003 [Ridgeia piscesae]|uniref:EGF-like domain-containing protein n=1 Tax=Ridgeia piscesae TaxID=27915 RepID=A0AAD9KWX0_RIDPI|nr:hypothetical protein NP493_516g02003 [Ridgeia piscesae]
MSWIGSLRLGRPGTLDSTPKVKTRWVFVEGTTCVDKIAEVTDFYNKVYLRECQWWQDLDQPPHSVAKSFVTECFDLSNGTTKYRANICCPGAVTRQRCFTCDSVVWQYDTNVGAHHSERCNHFVSRPQLCAAGEVCQATLNYNGSNTISKFCAPKATCEAKASNNSWTCVSGENIPSCTYCCEGPFCNYQTPLPWRSQRKKLHGCATTPCWYSGTCVDNSTDPRGYTCSCKPGTWGDSCHTCESYWHIMVVLPAPCENGGYIRREATAPYYHCYCRAGYKGVNCTEVSELCGHGSKYFSVNQQLALTASSNCTERHRDLSLTSYVSSCGSWMRGNFREGVNGHVSAVESMALSKCDRGDEATWYDLAICCPACLSAPCQNNGWCITGGADYVCQCRIGFEGKNCEHSEY